MSTTKSIIVYRNPAEAMMWDMIMNTQFGWWLIPVLGGIATALVVYIVIQLCVQSFASRWYWKNQHAVHHMMNISAVISFAVMCWYLWI